MKIHLYLVLLCFPSLLFAQKMSEKQYADLLNQEFQGIREHHLTSGRIDILTKEYAIEVERAAKWKQAIGQALWYGFNTNTQPGIILLLEKDSDYKYFLQLNSALDYSGLSDKIKVWLYPHDFPNLQSYQSSSTIPSTTNEVGYWQSKNSGIRHNSSCQYYKKTRGNTCNATEGTACKKCGGR